MWADRFSTVIALLPPSGRTGIKRASMTFAVVVALSGCATQAQMQFEVIKTGKQAIGAQLKICLDAVRKSPELASLQTHPLLDKGTVTLQQLSDQSLATPTEVQAILAVHPRMKQCANAAINGVAQTEPSVAPILTAAFARDEDDVLALTQRKITWGDYARRDRDRTNETKAAFQAGEQQIVAGLQREHQAEMAERQRAADALAEWALTQQMINAANRPVVTNCNAFGNMVNCISQ
jgi:hypothetical protein